MELAPPRAYAAPMKHRFLSLLVLTATLPALAAPTKCKGNPNVVAACYSVHGRLSIGADSVRLYLWSIGTKRMLGVTAGPRIDDADDPIWPRTLKVSPDDDVYADFEVCPFTPQRQGAMQLVCIESASHVVVKHTAAHQQQSSSTERGHILDGQFKVVSNTEDIPANVKKAFSTMTRQTSFEMANPGQAFQVTDEGTYRRLPWRRLVFAGVQGDDWFLHYERGGLAHSYYVVAFKADFHGDARFVWGCGVGESAKTLEQLRTMVATCKLADTESYW